jgi:hypothetical protein
MYAGAASLVVERVMSWPPDLPWELVRYALVALYVISLTVLTVTFIRQGRRRAQQLLDDRQE